MRYAIYALLLLLYALHTDVWYWDDPRIVAGLPIGVTYHVAWMVAVSVVFWLVVQYAWPSHLEEGGAGPLRPAEGAQHQPTDAASDTP